MNKVKFTFKIKELELHVEGTSNEVDTITSNIGQHVQGILTQTSALSVPPPQPSKGMQVTEEGEITEIKTQTKRRKLPVGRPRGEGSQEIDLKCDPIKYGAPIQSWSTRDKALWLSYVVSRDLSITELSAGEIAETFNKHFKQQRTIRPTNVSRDFGKLKAGAKALVGENTSSVPSKWFLTQEGAKTVEALIQDLKNSV